MKWPQIVLKALENLTSLLPSRVGNFLSALTKRHRGHVNFLTAADFQSFRRAVEPPARFIYDGVDERSMVVAAVTGGGRVFVTEEVSRATLFRIYEQVSNGLEITTHVVMVDELDTTVDDHYGGNGAKCQALDTTIEDGPCTSVTSSIAEIIIRSPASPGILIEFKPKQKHE